MGLKRPRIQSRRQKEALLKYRPVTITLRAQHCLNGVYYGPGTIKVKGDVARQLMEQDQATVKADQDLFSTRALMLVYTPHRGVMTVEVSPDSFDAVWTNPSTSLISRF